MTHSDYYLDPLQEMGLESYGHAVYKENTFMYHTVPNRVKLLCKIINMFASSSNYKVTFS